MAADQPAQPVQPPLSQAANAHFDLVRRCQRGDRRAQFDLYKLYAKAMYNICVRMMGHAHDAEDVLQVAFVDVFTKLDSFRFESSVGAWIKRVVVNSCINHLRQKKLFWEELDPRFDAAENTQEYDIPEHLSVEAIKKSVQRLPDGYRVVLSLYLFEGYDHQEIGEILGVTEATSKSQYSRARRKLREFLQAPGH